MTFPIAGFPPQFAVKVGPNCDATGGNPFPPNPLAATCGFFPTPAPAPGCQPDGPFGPAGGSCSGITCCSGGACVPGTLYTQPNCPPFSPGPGHIGSIKNANFGITQQFYPWMQSVGNSMRVDSGFTDPIPGSAIGGAYASRLGSGGTPGIIFSGGTNPYFGTGGSASTTPFNWKVGNSLYPEIFTPSQYNVIKTSYDWLLAVALKNGITLTDIAASCTGGISSCTLSLPNDPGLFIANGSLNIVNPSYTFPAGLAGEDYVILVDGDLTLQGNLFVPNGSTVTFAVKGDIKVNGDVGELTSSSTTPNLEGYYSTDKNFIIRDDSNDTDDTPLCPTPDRRLNVAGTVITNASLTGGSLQNHRSLCTNNKFYPSLYITERVDFILNAPQFIQSSQTIWQEVAP